MTISTVLRDRLALLRAEVREHRQERAQLRTLQRELASYRNPREIDDLLGVIAHQEGPDAQRVRDILLDNVRPAVGLGRIG